MQLECIETVQEDADMQGLLIQSLWVLNQKMMKYYQNSRSIYGKDSGLLEVGPSDEKCECMICMLIGLTLLFLKCTGCAQAQKCNILWKVSHLSEIGDKNNHYHHKPIMFIY